ncbi:MAG: hypothetical protein UU71_C0007G0022 [Parcubacteria group bacterium GW2011_GWB1_41_6]|nr:MAG: hypothetical protein UU71_C0007G0022 [Parcubacteria group bacterium GW2011_GWB1_41_6]KKS34291.1 MAG: hypothetical protein UU96_C0006G0029 [Parcubacteria group bacterium GW2011_GWC2_42_13]KKS57814.1 MAG: hypothetical protein UV22_C0012G0020 [Parcubacteria group bacterium GW2011_GWA2_42_35]KKS70448.1 MAG: hypothetical protein UV43_C0062G0005 [Parcubacteria group bacterium GW2011_GWF2_42_7]
MATTRHDIAVWLQRGKDQNATHMIVVCDTFNWEDYPVYVLPGEDPREKETRYDGKDMQKIMEVYSFSLDLDMQLNEHRASHY